MSKTSRTRPDFSRREILGGSLALGGGLTAIGAGVGAGLGAGLGMGIGAGGSGSAGLASFGCCGAASAQEAAHPEREIVEIARGLWRTRQNRHHGLVIEGQKGLLVFDSIDQGFAGWLKSQLGQMSDKPISHVVYSHNHADHVSGGEMLEADGVRYISHELARDSQVRSRLKTRYADTTFHEGLEIDLGDRRVELRYHGPNDGRGSISLRVPDQALLSVVDWVLVDRMPFMDLARYQIDGMVHSTEQVLDMDWELIAPGHAGMGGKAEVRNYLAYITQLRDLCMEHVVAGTPPEKAADLIAADLGKVDSFRALNQFDAWVRMNATGVMDQLARVEGFIDPFPPVGGTLD
ncbi:MULTISPECIES: MBL fold metallo-hydrolase [unclassified Iodidimonas]|uniref:MBL fold metallo-hydrolase n=1 Tax=unclassified Iodidimonas TaxID=2626145 RepID=UPI002482893E|nr:MULTISPECIES: MBL fold metallo-hydrolase [unclassified Iodidimonas]